MVPVVHPGPAQGSIVEPEPQTADKMEMHAGSGTQAGDITGIRGDFRFNQHNVKHPLIPWALADAIPFHSGSTEVPRWLCR
jgi:hypothetical protein